MTPPARGGDFPVDVVIASAGEPQRLAELANQLVVKAFGSGMFIFADADVKCDQPQAEGEYSTVTSSDRRAWISDRPGRISARCSAALRQPLQHPGRSYKVIPQIKRAERLTPDQLKDVYVTGRATGSMPLSVRLAAHVDGAAAAEEVSAAEPCASRA